MVRKIRVRQYEECLIAIKEFFTGSFARDLFVVVFMFMTNGAGAIEPQVNRAALEQQITNALRHQHHFLWEMGFTLNLREAVIDGGVVHFKVRIIPSRTTVNEQGGLVVYHDVTALPREEYRFRYYIATDQVETDYES